MDRIKLDKFLEKLDKIVSQQGVFKKFIYSFLVWNFQVLWKIDKWLVSRIIQAFTQSLYSHVAFCQLDGDKLYVFWAENLKKVKITQYPIKWKNVVYVIKQFDIDEVMSYFDKKDYSNTLLFFLWPKCAENFNARYENFINRFSSVKYKNWISLWDLVEFELDFEMFGEKLQEIKLDLEKLQQEVNDIVLPENNAKFLKKLFFTWGMFKFIVFAYGEKYDFSGALSIVFSPFRKNLFADNGKLFCSEFVASAMLYAWFYPFDMLTKSPSMITPGDLMDPTFWIWKTKYKVIDARAGKIYKINNFEDMKEVKKVIWKN